MITASAGAQGFATEFTNGRLTAVANDKGESIKPHELLEAALATCVSMTVKMYAAHHNMPLNSVQTRVEVDSKTEGTAVFRYDVSLDGPDLTSEMRAKLLQIAQRCPVRRTLSKAIQFEGF